MLDIMLGDFDNKVKMMIDFDRKLSALEILILNNFMICIYLILMKYVQALWINQNDIYFTLCIERIFLFCCLNKVINETLINPGLKVYYIFIQ